MHSPKSEKKKARLDSLGFLRGVAVLMVCFCHYGGALMQGNPLAGIFDTFHRYGEFGVQVFFVISGFIIPYSLHKGKFASADYFIFLKKRFYRLHPPYLAALLFTLIAVYLSSKVGHVVFPETPVSILKSLFYLYAPASNPVFWTLFVEAQYYIFIGLFYIVYLKRPGIALFVIIPVVMLISLNQIRVAITLLFYIGIFLMGTIGFLIYVRVGNRTQNWIALAMVMLFSLFVYKLPAFIVATATLAFILSYRGTIAAWLQFPGKISYSLYLIHFVIGVKLINLIKPRINPAYSWSLFLITLVVVVIASWIFYLVFEVYSENLSKKVTYTAANENLPKKNAGELK